MINERRRYIVAYIYQITNKINGKVYVGKTEFSIEKRFKEHCSDAFKERCEKRPLYSAMRKYGVENFEISLLEETDNPEEREIFWINEKNSYHHGYNATLGGDGKKYFDHCLIISLLQENPYPTKIAKQIGCSSDLVRAIAKEYKIPIRSASNDTMREKAVQVGQYDKSNNLIQTFDSIANAGKWCFENNKCSKYTSGVRGHISECAKGKRKSAYGYIWKYI